MRLVVSANAAWNLVNFRAGLIAGLVADGHEVVAAAPADAASPRLAALGCRVVDLRMAPRGTDPAAEAALCARYLALMARERPHAVLGFTVKPNVYGGLAARAVGAAAIANVSGLGAAFARETALTGLVRRLYRHALAGAHVFFQNEDDLSDFAAAGLVTGRAAVLPGSGVDLARFAPPAGGGGGGGFLFVGRLLWEKGLAEYVAAARIVKAHRPDAVFRIVGFAPDGPGAVTPGDIAAWMDEGVVEYRGAAEDVRPVLAAADCVVLPSFYREGTPRVLLEAAAMGRPIVTTDRPGCRDTVLPGVSGFLVPPRDVEALAAALLRVAALPPAARAAMGAASRRHAEARFDEAQILAAYRAVLAEVEARARPRRARVRPA